MTHELFPRKIRRYDGSPLVDAKSVDVEQALPSLTLPAGATVEQAVEYAGYGIGAAKEIAEHAVRMVEGLEEGETDTFRDATADDERAGYRLTLVAAGTALNQVMASFFSGAAEMPASGSYDVYVVAPEGIPTRRLRVDKRRNNVSRNMFPGNGQHWAAVALPTSVLPHTQVYRLALAADNSAAPVTANGTDTFLLQTGTPVSGDTSGLRTRVGELEDHAVQVYAALPDVDDFADGQVVIVGEHHYRRVAGTNTQADEFVMVAVRHTQRADSSIHWVGASLDISDQHAAFGSFPSNYEHRLGGLWAFNGGHSVTLDAAAYATAKGSAPAKGDSIRVTLAPVGDVETWRHPYSFVASIPTEADFSLADAIRQGWIPFLHYSTEASLSLLYNHGADRDVIIGLQNGDMASDDVLFSHVVGAPTWVRWTESDAALGADVVRYQPVRNVQAVEDGAVVVADNAMYQAAAASNADEFSGMAGLWMDGDVTYRGTALADTRYGSQGSFTSNPGFGVGSLVAGGDHADTVALHLEQRRYVQVKGSAVADGDEVIVQVTVGASTTRSTLTYVRSESAPGGDPVYLVFIVRDEDSALHDIVRDGPWTMSILSAYDSQTGRGTALYTHGRASRHLVEYPMAGVDRTARDKAQANDRSIATLMESMAALTARVASLETSEIFTIPQAGTNGVARFDPVVLATQATGDSGHLVGSFLGDVNVIGRPDELNDGIEGIALSVAAGSRGPFRMLSWGLLGNVPMGPEFTHAELQTPANQPPGKPVYCTARNARVRPGGSTDNRRTGSALTHWTLDEDESGDGIIYGYCVAWEGAAGTSQQGLYSVIFDFRRAPFRATT